MVKKARLRQKKCNTNKFPWNKFSLRDNKNEYALVQTHGVTYASRAARAAQRLVQRQVSVWVSGHMRSAAAADRGSHGGTLKQLAALLGCSAGGVIDQWNRKSSYVPLVFGMPSACPRNQAE